MWFTYNKRKCSGSYNSIDWVDILIILRADGQNVCITKMRSISSLTKRPWILTSSQAFSIMAFVVYNIHDIITQRKGTCATIYLWLWHIEILLPSDSYSLQINVWPSDALLWNRSTMCVYIPHCLNLDCRSQPTSYSK